jgi:hypothetical protein
MARHGTDEHEIVLGHTADSHQNPICRTCGQPLNLEEFDSVRTEG